MRNDEIDLLAPVKANLYQHQLSAVNFVCDLFGLFDGRIKSRGACLLMEMGTGKSLTAITIAGFLYQIKGIRRILIVAPLSILGVWESEFKTYADFPYYLEILKGSCEKKRRQLQQVPDEKLTVIVVNYESAWRLQKELLSYNADLIIADEGHKLKEGRTAQSKCMHLLGDKARYKLLLTGTPVTGKELDVFSEYRFANSEIFGTSFYAFRNRYFYMGGYGGYVPIFKTYLRDEFLRKMHSIAFRTTKAECLDLPEITEEVRSIELEPKAWKLYQQIEKESYAQLAESEVSTVNVLTKILRLSQLTGGHLTDDDGDTNMVSKAKLSALSDIIDSALEEDQKLVIMARFVPELNDIQGLLEKKKIEYAVIRGGVKDRADQVKQFQNDPECRIFVGQIAAAGLGLTLTAAHTMVFYSLDYNMSNFDQSKARIHRVGQRNNCHYIFLIAMDTVDEKILKSLRGKIDLAKMLVDDFRRGKNPFQIKD